MYFGFPSPYRQHYFRYIISLVVYKDLLCLYQMVMVIFYDERVDLYDIYS